MFNKSRNSTNCEFTGSRDLEKGLVNAFWLVIIISTMKFKLEENVLIYLALKL